VFVDHLGLPPGIYSLVLAGIAVGMVIGGQINVLPLSRWTEWIDCVHSRRRPKGNGHHECT
jgi:hypothetical protein